MCFKFSLIFFEICAVWSTYAAPVQKESNLLDTFLKDMHDNYCNMMDFIVLPLYANENDTLAKNIQIAPEVNKPHVYDISIPLKVCTIPEMKSSVAPLCNETFEIMHQISSCGPDVQRLVSLKQKVENIIIMANSENVCKGFSVNQSLFDHNSLAFKLSDPVICSLLCQDQLANACSFLLWSHQVQAAVRGILNANKPKQSNLETGKISGQDDSPTETDPDISSHRQNIAVSQEELGNNLEGSHDAAEGNHQEKGAQVSEVPNDVKTKSGEAEKNSLLQKIIVPDANKIDVQHENSNTISEISESSKSAIVETSPTALDVPLKISISTKDSKNPSSSTHTVLTIKKPPKSAGTLNPPKGNVNSEEATIELSHGHDTNKDTGNLGTEKKEANTEVSKNEPEKKEANTEVSKNNKDNRVKENAKHDDMQNPSTNPSDSGKQDIAPDAQNKENEISNSSDNVKQEKPIEDAASSAGGKVDRKQSKVDEADTTGDKNIPHSRKEIPANDPSQLAEGSQEVTAAGDSGASSIKVPLEKMGSDNDGYDDRDLENGDQYPDYNEQNSSPNGPDDGKQSQIGDVLNESQGDDDDSVNEIPSGNDIPDPIQNVKKTAAPSTKADDSFRGENQPDGFPDPFPEQEDTHFFFYFVTVVIFAISGYVLYHNKQKIFALIIEGRHERRRRSGANYRKLDAK